MKSIGPSQPDKNQNISRDKQGGNQAKPDAEAQEEQQQAPAAENKFVDRDTMMDMLTQQAMLHFKTAKNVENVGAEKAMAHFSATFSPEKLDEMHATFESFAKEEWNLTGKEPWLAGLIQESVDNYVIGTPFIDQEAINA